VDNPHCAIDAHSVAGGTTAFSSLRASNAAGTAMIWIVLPAYNERENIDAVLRGLREVFPHQERYRVLVIDDGSTDDTARIVERNRQNMPVRVVSHVRNQGLAQAIRTGLSEVDRNAENNDVLVIMDADNSHPSSLIPRLVEELDAGADVVIASRFQRGGQVFGVPLMRRVLSRGASLVFRVLFPIPGVRDYTGGYRAYRVGIVRRAMVLYGTDFLRSTGFSIMTELLLKLRALQPRVREVPLVLRYDLKKGKSKLVPSATIAQYLALIGREFQTGKTLKRE
jgi:dolichol-phosphate mannosyltransferase